MEIFNKTVLLNSHSPRRKQILEEMGFNIKLVSSVCEETFPQNLPLEQVAAFLAKKKNDAYSHIIKDNEILISADTVVIADNTILGKPKDEKDAFFMLKNLSGKEHTVVTGCCLRTRNNEDCFFESTQVRFSLLSDDEIRYYIKKKHPLDKAGAYGIQEWIGMTGICEIKGDYYNVMGLPACKLWQRIKNLR
ncbi:MAG: septum formation protein Maf [Bacteroidales bacterium]|nr:septum formation protein Maf [Bacteroidales bacterium]